MPKHITIFMKNCDGHISSIVKSIMKNHFSYLLFAIIALLCQACDDTTDRLGYSVTDIADKVIIEDSTFFATTRSIQVDSVLSRSIYNYIGQIKDVETGTYVTAHYTTQFHILEDFTGNMDLFLPKDSIKSFDTYGEICADSCFVFIYINSFVGDSLNPMRLTMYELDEPIEEGKARYTNYSPENDKDKGNLIRQQEGIRKNQTYTIYDLSLSDSLRGQIADKKSYPYISIPLNDEYTDKQGRKYKNYGSYIMQQYYEHPEYFKNSYQFAHHVCPGFYFKSTDGIGVMSEIYLTELHISYRALHDGVTDNAQAVLTGTEEVLQTTTFINDKNTIKTLAENQDFTYMKTPSGIFTEVTLPVEQMKQGHENDTLSAAKIVFQKYNSQDIANTLTAPENVLMVPYDSLFTFFEKNKLPDNKLSFIASYSSTYNTYTFNNISSLISEMYNKRRAGNTSANWNKVVLVPVSISTSSSSTSSSSTINRVTNDLSIKSAKLVGGGNHPNTISIDVTYNKFGQ